MKITSIKKEAFKPIDITIRIESEYEFYALRQMSCLDVSIPEEVVIYNTGKMSDARLQEIIENFLGGLHDALRG